MRRLRDVRQYILVAGVLLLFIACDVMYGVSRNARLDEVPDVVCVQKVLAEVAPITTVRYEQSAGSRPITLDGFKNPDVIRKFMYAGDGFRGELLIVSSERGGVEFCQHLSSLNRKIPQTMIDRVRPIMWQVEHRIEHECGIKNLASSIEEVCSQVECKSLE